MQIINCSISLCFSPKRYDVFSIEKLLKEKNIEYFWENFPLYADEVSFGVAKVSFDTLDVNAVVESALEQLKNKTDILKDILSKFEGDIVVGVWFTPGETFPIIKFNPCVLKKLSDLNAEFYIDVC